MRCLWSSPESWECSFTHLKSNCRDRRCSKLGIRFHREYRGTGELMARSRKAGLKVVSLFSGAGGLDLGFVRHGFKIVWANDNYSDAVETYRNNIGRHVQKGDICEIPSSSIPDCDIVVGGFPCQGFSVANIKRSAKDSRNKLYIEMLRIIRDKKPDYFIAENVKGLMSLDRGKVLEMIIGDFERAGYHVKYRLLNAADYGVPQIRQRIFIIGTRKELPTEIAFPEPTHADPQTNPARPTKPWVSVGEALKGMPAPGERCCIPNHTYSKYKLNYNGYLGHRPLDPTRPAPTVTGRGDEKGGVVVLPHPSNERRMSARELATVQSFPVDFTFAGSQTSAYRQIANAVPPLMAEAIAGCIKNGG